MRSRGFGEAPFLSDLGLFGCYCKGWSSDSWLPLPRPVVRWGGALCRCEGRMLLALLGFLTGQIVLLFIALCFQGKQHLCVCVCAHMRVRIVCM